MTAALGGHPYALLRDIEARSRQKARGLPQQLEARPSRVGVGFRLQDMVLVVPTQEITEIMRYPELTRLPGTVSWMRGIANIRGALIPIIDLVEFVTGEKAVLDRKSRVLVMRRGDLISGLLVSEVLGLRHFFDEEKTEHLPELPSRLRTFLNGAYHQGERHWGIFSTRHLADSPEFMEVAREA